MEEQKKAMPADFHVGRRIYTITRKTSMSWTVWVHNERQPFTSKDQALVLSRISSVSKAEQSQTRPDLNAAVLIPGDQE